MGGCRKMVQRYRLPGARYRGTRGVAYHTMATADTAAWHIAELLRE